MKKDKRTMLQRFCFLAKQLEDSKHYALNAIQPGLIDVEKKLVVKTNHNGRFFEEEQVDKKVLNDVVKELVIAAEYLQCTCVQAALFSAIFSESSTNRAFGLSSLGHFFSIDSVDVQCLQHDYEILQNSRLLEAAETFRDQPSFVISKEVLTAIHNDESIDNISLDNKEKTRYDFVTNIGNWVEDNNIKTGDLLRKLEREEEQSMDLNFVQSVKKILPVDLHRVLFYDICYDFISSRRRESDIDHTLSDIFDSVSRRFLYAKELMNKDHELIKLDLIEIGHGRFFSDATMKLTDKGRKLFLEDDFELFVEEKIKNDQLIYPDDIPEKRLFFDDEISKQLNLLKENLQEERFVELQKRLSERHLPKGVAAIFHGSPGTGKTETAKQIAKATGRPVYHVDIAGSKSCWFGESEKIIKSIFTNYAELCKKNDVKPILLFNEADALFSKRKDSNFSNVAQTENAIQNIILEEMEKLDGILIATTNLVDNLDSAFERRFLFKIRFNNPTTDAKQSIWKSKLSWLTDDESRALAERYNFSGGEIDNIVRKVIMEEVLNGQRPGMQFIDDLCRHEKINNNGENGIGFKG